MKAFMIPPAAISLRSAVDLQTEALYACSGIGVDSASNEAVCLVSASTSVCESARWESMSWAHWRRLSLPLKNWKGATGQYGRLAASEQLREVTLRYPPRVRRADTARWCGCRY